MRPLSGSKGLFKWLFDARYHGFSGDDHSFESLEIRAHRRLMFKGPLTDIQLNLPTSFVVRIDLEGSRARYLTIDVLSLYYRNYIYNIRTLHILYALHHSIVFIEAYPYHIDSIHGYIYIHLLGAMIYSWQLFGARLGLLGHGLHPAHQHDADVPGERQRPPGR